MKSNVECRAHRVQYLDLECRLPIVHSKKRSNRRRRVFRKREEVDEILSEVLGKEGVSRESERKKEEREVERE